ncbi:MAG TPA: molybdenum cofactor guanylyltransferase [Candidatus Dormibacteraeota bacterium]|nr:molybdenum cofactor guanylyltransferase [Candidatus Dormibacteraeota bacterium]
MLAGVVLCGGGSRRMGVDKARLVWDGEPLVARVARRLAEVADPVLLAPGELGRLAAVPEVAGLGQVADAAASGQVADAAGPGRVVDAAGTGAGGASAGPGRRGPLAAIAGALSASPHDRLAVVAVDLPDLSPALLAAMAAGLGPDADVALPLVDGGPQPLHAVYSRRALAALRAALDGGRLALRDALAGLRVDVWDEPRWRPIAAPGFARNLNTPADLPAAPAGVRAPSRRTWPA